MSKNRKRLVVVLAVLLAVLARKVATSDRFRLSRLFAIWWPVSAGRYSSRPSGPKSSQRGADSSAEPMSEDGRRGRCAGDDHGSHRRGEGYRSDEADRTTESADDLDRHHLGVGDTGKRLIRDENNKRIGRLAPAYANNKVLTVDAMCRGRPGCPKPRAPTR